MLQKRLHCKFFLHSGCLKTIMECICMLKVRWDKEKETRGGRESKEEKQRERRPGKGEERMKKKREWKRKEKRKKVSGIIGPVRSVYRRIFGLDWKFRPTFFLVKIKSITHMDRTGPSAIALASPFGLIRSVHV